MLIEGINPEPWTAPEIGRGRVFKKETLRTYQNAVKECIESEFEGCVPAFDKGVRLAEKFYFWRQLDMAEIGGRNRRRKEADATNMQKALEDALQGVVFPNDRAVIDVQSRIVEVGVDVEPRILIDLMALEDTFTSYRHETLLETMLERLNPSREFAVRIV